MENYSWVFNNDNNNNNNNNNMCTLYTVLILFLLKACSIIMHFFGIAPKVSNTVQHSVSTTAIIVGRA